LHNLLVEAVVMVDTTLLRLERLERQLAAELASDSVVAVALAEMATVSRWPSAQNFLPTQFQSADSVRWGSSRSQLEAVVETADSMSRLPSQARALVRPQSELASVAAAVLVATLAK
jgi:hypothetical protein